METYNKGILEAFPENSTEIFSKFKYFTQNI